MDKSSPEKALAEDATDLTAAAFIAVHALVRRGNLGHVSSQSSPRHCF